MKRILLLMMVSGILLNIQAQEVLGDEMLQARVHYMNAAKVSYIASVDDVIDDQPGSHEPDIPEEIQASFNSHYPEAEKTNWVIKEDRYKVNFDHKGKSMFAYLDRHGRWMKSFTKLPDNQLPETIGDYLVSHYPGYQLAKYYLKDTPNGQSYTLAVKKDREYVWLEFDQEGNILSNQV